MTTDFRALCAELLNGLDELAHPRYPFPGYTRCAMDRARTLLAQPEPAIPVKQQIFPTPSQAAECGGPCYEGSYCPEACDCGLRRSPTPQPVAVSERLPGPKDCEAGECWAWDVAAESWNRTHYALCNHFTHWLPANALPTPEALDD